VHQLNSKLDLGARTTHRTEGVVENSEAKETKLTWHWKRCSRHRDSGREKEPGSFRLTGETVERSERKITGDWAVNGTWRWCGHPERGTNQTGRKNSESAHCCAHAHEGFWRPDSKEQQQENKTKRWMYTHEAKT
jgi:hypothetical protein